MLRVLSMRGGGVCACVYVCVMFVEGKEKGRVQLMVVVVERLSVVDVWESLKVDGGVDKNMVDVLC